MIMVGRRTAYEIYWEILVFCKTPRTFTAIIGRCDLNSKTGQEHLGFLIDRGYLTPDNDDDGQDIYRQRGRMSTSLSSADCIKGPMTLSRGSGSDNNNADKKIQP